MAVAELEKEEPESVSESVSESDWGLLPGDEEEERRQRGFPQRILGRDAALEVSLQAVQRVPVCVAVRLPCHRLRVLR